MKPYILLFFLLLSNSIFAQNIVCFDIESNPSPSDPALGVFTKYVDVYGCSIYAEDAVTDEKVLHAAAIFAELLDNNEDGIVDDPALLAQLQIKNAMMPVFTQDGSSGMNTFFNNYNGDGVSAVLWQTEMDPSQPGHWGSDATIEEILHTINHVGHTNIYAAAFSLAPNSSLMTAAMDVARGGQYLSVPNTYPTVAWYHYDDATCDYGCMAIEYMYWSIVSLMGILDDPSTCSGIANEWEPCSPTLFQSTDTLMYNLITDPQYKLPQLAPDGNYCPTATGFGTRTEPEGKFKVYPNPTSDWLRIWTEPMKYNRKIYVFNSMGQQIKEMNLSNNQTETEINISEFKMGIHYIKVGLQTSKFIVK